jgi:hypothetical protein
MKHSLLLVAVVAALALAGPAYSQYIYVDVDGDGVSTTADVLTPATASIDIYLDTNHNGDGSAAVCNTGSEELNIGSYEFILHATGAVTYGTWVDNMGFTVLAGDANAGGDFYVGRGSAAAQPAGLYRLGTLPVSGVASGAVVSFATSTTAFPTGTTSFGTFCLGNGFDNTYRLSDDWNDAQGTYPPTPVAKTTWGKIKDLYK